MHTYVAMGLCMHARSNSRLEMYIHTIKPYKSLGMGGKGILKEFTTCMYNYHNHVYAFLYTGLCTHCWLINLL